MLFEFPCPNCEGPVTASAEQLGQAVRCPNCQRDLQVPQLPIPALQPTDAPQGDTSLPRIATKDSKSADSEASAPASGAPSDPPIASNPFAEHDPDAAPVHEDGEVDDNPYASPAAVGQLIADTFGSTAHLNKVVLGLKLVYIGLSILLTSLLAAGLIVSETKSGTIINAAVLLGSAGSMLGSWLGLVGRCFCIALPARTGARGFIVTAVFFDVLATTLRIAPLAADVPIYFSRLASLYSLLASLVFLFFLQRVSGYIRRTDLRDRSRFLITLSCVGFAVHVVRILAARFLPLLSAPATLAFLMISFVVLVRYARLLVDLRYGILDLEAQAAA